MRELSTFIYAEKPAFLSDPFLTRDGNQAEMAKAQEPGLPGDHAQRQERPVVQGTPARRDAQSEEGCSTPAVPVVMGTDTGPPYRFQGYFEHLELEYMVKAGLTPMQAHRRRHQHAGALRSKPSDQIGSLERGQVGRLRRARRKPARRISQHAQAGVRLDRRQSRARKVSGRSEMSEAWAFEHSVECAATREFAWVFWTEVSNWKLDADVESVELTGPFATGSHGITVRAERWDASSGALRRWRRRRRRSSRSRRRARSCNSAGGSTTSAAAPG